MLLIAVTVHPNARVKNTFLLIKAMNTRNADLFVITFVFKILVTMILTILWIL